MIESQTITDVAGRLLELAGRLREETGFAEVVASLKAGHGATLGGVWGSSCALAAAALEAEAPATLVIVCPNSGDIDGLCDDLAIFTSVRPERFGAWESAPGERAVDDEIHGDRLRILKMLAGDEAGRPRLIVTSIQSLLQPVPPLELLRCQTRVLRVGDEIDADELLRWMAAGGFVNTTAVGLPGEFSPRGGIVDVFAPDWDEPVRIELFGDRVESLRRFEVASQRSLQPLDSVEITVLKPSTEHRDHLAAYLPPNSWFFLVEPQEIEEEARHYLQRLERPGDVHETAEVLAEIYRFPSVTASGVSSGSMEATCHLRIESVERFSGDIGKVRDELDSAGAGQELFLLCQTEAELERLSEVFGSTRLAAAGKLHLMVGQLRAGFRIVSDRIVLVSGNELFHRGDLRPPQPPAARPRDRQLSRSARRGLRRPSCARHRPL